MHDVYSSQKYEYLTRTTKHRYFTVTSYVSSQRSNANDKPDGNIDHYWYYCQIVCHMNDVCELLLDQNELQLLPEG